MSSFLDPYIGLLEYLAVWVAIFGLAVLLKADKHGVIAKPYYLMLKTAVFNRWMERLANRFRRGWLTYFDIGALMGIGLIPFAFYLFIANILNLFTRAPQAGRTLLIIPLPGLTIRWDIFPYILISIALLLIPHELSHGIASALDKVPIKSSGVFLAIFLPGGFVEIDEEDLAKRKARTKLRVFAGGSYTNMVSFFLVLLVATNFALVISPLYEPNSSGVLITDLVNGGAAQSVGIQRWSVLTYINTTQVQSVSDLQTLLAPLRPGDNLTLTLSSGQIYPITARPSPENATRGIVGIVPYDYHRPRFSFLPIRSPYDFAATLEWMSLILPGVALVNMLPMVPFDGDRYFDTLLTRLGLKNTKSIRTFASTLSLLLLGSNLILSYATFGTVFPK